MSGIYTDHVPSEQELDALYAEHSRMGHDQPSGPYDGECMGCLHLDQLANWAYNHRPAPTGPDPMRERFPTE